MGEVVIDRRFSYFSRILLKLLGIGLAAVAVAVSLAANSYIADAVLIRDLSALRIDGQRFFRAALVSGTKNQEAFNRAVLSGPLTPRVNALLKAGRGEFHLAANILSPLVDANPRDAELLNDLGVVYSGLGGPSNYLRALDLFERSALLKPRAAAPRFNLVGTYRKLGMQTQAEVALKEYLRIENNFDWVHELSGGITENDLLQRLQMHLDRKENGLAKSLLRRHPVEYRAFALDAALEPPDSETIDNTAEFILEYFAKQDLTFRAILNPLQSQSRSRVLHARRLVREGLQAYYLGRSEKSLQLYELAQSALQSTDSTFDELWIDLKRADALLRPAGGDPQPQRAIAHHLLDSLLSQSKRLRLDWLFGQALTSKANGSMPALTQEQILPNLENAASILSAANAPREAARSQYYTAFTHGLAGDPDTSLKIAYRSLRATAPDDSVHLAQLYGLISNQVYRMGFEEYALPLAQQAVNEARKSTNPGLIATVIPSIARIQVGQGKFEMAEASLREAQKERDRMEPGIQETVDPELNLICSQIKIGTSHLEEAEDCLQRNLQIIRSLQRVPPDLTVQTLQQLAQVSGARDRDDETRRYLNAATRVVEQNDAYFAVTALRMPFENLRRSLYDAAIAFEYDHGGKDDAWGYVQHYRSKLFLEFLTQMNPNVSGILDKAVDRNEVQRLIPENLQTLEYVLLKDRLLIWVVSCDKFDSVSVPIPRQELEKKVSSFVELTTAQGDVQAPSEELYNLLILPVASYLDPKRSLAIIPDQALHRLNFPALYSSQSKKFLIQEFSIVESPNLTTLLSGGSAKPTRDAAISFGALRDATGATRELNGLRDYYPDLKIFNHADAVKAAFLSAMGEASIFHFAGHSQDAADPLRSAILLDGDREGPNSVTAVDISRHKMPANSVVVLASCDSSVGNSRDGIGMRGLTSAFLISGAGSVVGSLWVVDARSTSDLVLAFHDNFAHQHQSVAAALRQAQLALIEQRKPPYYWSGFVVTGNTTAFR